MAGVVFLIKPPRLTHDAPGLALIDGALVAALLVIALQMVPLPAAIADWLTPHAERVRQIVRLDALIASRDATRTLSVDARATLHAFGALLAAVLTFWTARAHLAEGGVRRACRALAVIGMVLAVEGLIQRAVSPGLLLGFWRPENRAVEGFGPFFNRNHFAGWLLMAIPVVTGYLLAHIRIRAATLDRSARSRAQSVFGSAGLLIAGAVLFMILALVSTLSRSAFMGLAVAAATGWAISRKQRAGERWFGAGALLAGAVVLVILSAYGRLDQLATRFSSTLGSTELGRVAIWRETLPMVRDFWLTGVGAGAFDVTMLTYQRTVIYHPHLGEYVRINHAHNHFLNIAAEGGVLLVVPLIVGLTGVVIAVRQRVRQERGEIFWVRAGAVGSLAGIAVESLWEVPLVTPANTILCAVVAAIALARPR